VKACELDFMLIGFSSNKLLCGPDTLGRWSQWKRRKSGSLHWQNMGHYLWHILEQIWCSGGLQTA